MNLCDLNCCDLKYLQRKFDAINKKINDNQKIQDKINANIFELLKESGIDVEKLLKNYYALNEEDYTKTLTSDDDVNTLEPGTYKIVKTDMPQNAPTGVASSDYDGTLIQSNSYAILFENGYLHIGSFFSAMNRFRWNYVINSNLINIHLQYYMLISRYSDGEFIDDIHTLNQNLTGVFIVNSTTQNLPVQQNGIIIVRIGTATNSLFVTFIPEDSFDVYHCAKKSDGTWTEWEQVAFLSDVPSLNGYATENWVNQQIQDITGGSVTADWVKSNYIALNSSQYTNINENENLNNYTTPGNFVCTTNTAASTIINSPTTFAFNLQVLNILDSNSIIQLLYTHTNKIYWRTLYETWNNWEQIVFRSNIQDMATQTWVRSQNYLTEIPDNYATDTEVTQAIATALVGYATQAWVNQQGFAKEDDIPSLSGYATQTWVNQQGFAKEDDIPSLSGYATQTWVNQQGFLTVIPEEYVTLTELQAQNYATQRWVNSQGFIKGNMTLYTTVDQLNISYPTTTLNVFKAMANNSLLIFGTDTTYITDLPVNSGILEITKVSNIRYKIVLYKSSGGTIPVNKGMYLATTNSTLDNLTWEAVVFTSDLNNEATQEWVEQQGYQTVQQVNSLINTATADMLTQEDLDTLNYATENWVLQTALDGYATENWVNTKLNNYLPKKETIALTTQGTYYGLQYQWVRYGQVVEVFLVGNLTQEISNQLISNFCPANPMGTLQITIAGYDSKTNYAEFNGNGLKLMGTYSNELYVNCHFTYLTNE